MLHHFILCPRYAAQRLTVLFTCAVQLLGSVWSDSIVSMERFNFVYTALKK
jgi:hypothetical protein